MNDTPSFRHYLRVGRDYRIMAMQVEHGIAGYGVYWALMEMLHNNKNCVALDYDSIGSGLGMSPESIRSIICDYELFEVSEGSFSHPLAHTSKVLSGNRLSYTDHAAWVSMSKRVFQRDNYTCQYCGERGIKLEADHIVPFSKGGKDCESNLITSCRRCNRQKRNKSVEEFLTWRERQ